MARARGSFLQQDASDKDKIFDEILDILTSPPDPIDELRNPIPYPDFFDLTRKVDKRLRISPIKRNEDSSKGNFSSDGCCTRDTPSQKKPLSPNSMVSTLPKGTHPPLTVRSDVSNISPQSEMKMKLIEPSPRSGTLFEHNYSLSDETYSADTNFDAKAKSKNSSLVHHKQASQDQVANLVSPGALWSNFSAASRLVRYVAGNFLSSSNPVTRDLFRSSSISSCLSGENVPQPSQQNAQILPEAEDSRLSELMGILLQMGFWDEDLNKKLLNKNKFDVNETINELLDLENRATGHDEGDYPQTLVVSSQPRKKPSAFDEFD